jgi:hypothetical protein
MVDTDLAEVYGVTTKRLNEQVKRNLERFPEDFAFRLTPEEKMELVAKCDRFSRLKHSSAFPIERNRGQTCRELTPGPSFLTIK